MDVFLSHKTALGIYFLAQERGMDWLYKALIRPTDDPLSVKQDAGTKAIGGKSAGAICGMTLDGFATCGRDLRRIDLDFLKNLDVEKIDILVPHRRRGFANKTVRQHVWAGEVPAGGFLKLGEHVYVSSPEFVLLQMAAELDRWQTLQLAMQLCGTFALSRTAEHGATKHPPLTSKRRLALFAEQVGGRRTGMGNYRWAVRHVLNGAASTTEAGVSLLLAMPTQVGGYGLRPFQLNVEKTYDQEEREIAGGKERCVVDLLDETSRFGWEYQGKEGHSDAEGGARYERGSVALSTAAEGDLDFTMSYGAAQLDSDARKLAALRHMEYEVRPLVWGQIKTVGAFEHVARETARQFGTKADGAYAFSDDRRLADRRARLHRGLLLRRYYWQGD